MKKNLLLFIAIVSVQFIFAQEQSVKIGDIIKPFQGLADNGQIWNAKNFLGKKNLVVYFYPAAMTGGCTKEACGYRDDIQSLKDLNTVVVGVSGDKIDNLKLFKKVYNLNFTLLSDTAGIIASAFGVPVQIADKSLVRNYMGKDYTLSRDLTASRWTFVIDSSGKLIYKSTKVDPANDSKEVISVLNNIQHKSDK